MSSNDSKTPQSDENQSRREFVRRIGSAVFSIAIVEIAHETAIRQSLADVVCGRFFSHFSGLLIPAAV